MYVNLLREIISDKGQKRVSAAVTDHQSERRRAETPCTQWHENNENTCDAVHVTGLNEATIRAMCKYWQNWGKSRQDTPLGVSQSSQARPSGEDILGQVRLGQVQFGQVIDVHAQRNMDNGVIIPPLKFEPPSRWCYKMKSLELCASNSD